MGCITNKAVIENTFSTLREFSFNEKKVSSNEINNKFLDAILDFKNEMTSKTDLLYSINEKIESITWQTDLDKECLMLLNDTISLAKDAHDSLIRQYVGLEALRKKSIAKTEITDFKNAIDELKEIYTDLEAVFFFLPEMPDFVETTKELVLV